MNRRKEVLEAFIRYESARPTLFEQLRAYPLDWSGPALAILTKASVVTVLDRFLQGDLDAAGLKAWGEQLEGREDLDYEAKWEAKLKDVVFRIATPEINELLSMESVQNMRMELNDI